MIKFENISKSYGEQTVITDFSFQFKEGELTMFLGHSGCGKSTLLRLINRLITPDKGEIYIDDKNVKYYQLDALRRNIGYSIQSVGLFPHMDVGKNIATVPNLLKWSDDRIQSRIDELLELVGLPLGFKHKYPSELSGGEAQRVGVARALASNPDILLMDEPFGALDPINRLRLQNEFLYIQKKLKKTVIFVTHDISEAIRMADRIILISEGGSIVASGTPFEVIQELNGLSNEFLGTDFMFNLLDKSIIKDYTDSFEVVADSIETFDIDVNVSLKDALSTMLSRGKSSLVLKGENENYVVSFDHVLDILGGQTHG